ncbi:hypothetical protein OPKNFCMD_6821 [Methylobacterium crusticola]|uniref:Uncharacterized protein n=1 Tax=Methylobacterium crusticola TaxID=1697972 RepID=A0ABQ4R9M4_9HYPH|nr:hypothetical protein OPKNFCMD_6821 [Methylobacterium crusticola]
MNLGFTVQRIRGTPSARINLGRRALSLDPLKHLRRRGA